MKKLLAIVLTLVLALSFCACESKEERAARELKEAFEDLAEDFAK